MGNIADKMYEGLWLGEHTGITSKSDNILDLHAIDIIITVMSAAEVEKISLAHHIPAHPPRQWIHFDIDDTDEEDIRRYFEEVHQILKSAKRQGKRVYIHCAAGISRSPTLVAAHLMLENNWTRKTAIEYISKRRTQINPNDGFMNQLKILEEEIRRRLDANGVEEVHYNDVGNVDDRGDHESDSCRVDSEQKGHPGIV